MKNKGTLRTVLSYISRHKFLLICLVLFSVAFSLLALYIPIIIGDAIDLAVEKGRVDFDGIKTLLFKVLFVTGLTALFQWLVSIIGNRITFSVVRDIRQEAFDNLVKLPLSYIDSHKHGDIVSRIIADAGQFADGLIMGFTQLFTGVVTILGTIVFMVQINYKIALIVVLLTPLSLFVASFIAKNTHSMFKKQSETRGEMTGVIDEMVSGQKIVRAFGYEERAQKKFDEVNSCLEKHSLRAIFFSSLTNPSTRFVNSVVYAFVGGFGAFVVIGGAMTVGGLSCFLSYAGQYTKPFNEISGVVTELQNSLACAARVFEFINTPPETEDATLTLTSPEGSVDFKEVDFSYNKNTKLIEDFNLSVAPGQRVAIVGPTGCGKTTLINLIMRFYDVDDGEITVDGKNTKSITRHNLRSNFGMVLQDTWIKKGSVAENIAMGKPDATRDEIINAAKASHAHNFIKKLPKGYDTIISETEGGLSQGQRQLLCISRVMLTLPPMLILDEATSSIDTRTEKKIQDAFAKLMEGKTSFIVAHRLSTIREADVILVMRDGKVIEAGSHSELIAKNGFYTELYNSQSAVV
ncbi:MAG: ABC transporter ATP-binding protein [Ruminococcaceae bacterium]|nr:ABC transporter ATP-binding protein [Oscillospiraceae bacterium]